MTRSVGKWKLPPLIDVQENNEWVSIPRMSRTIPFGYEIDETDDNILVPIPDQLNKLETAKQYLKQYSYREVANWLSTNTGRTISYEGLRKRLDNEQKRNSKARSLRQWAEYAEKAISKAEEIEKSRIGARETITI
jgi:hypothetical protein|tara:strand:- start:119 stop:526 length:408 start_codon:yes stop_codon:yes gene_type:complete